MPTQAQAVRFNAGGIYVDGDLSIPGNATGVVLFVHGSGSSRHSPRNQFVAENLQAQELGTVLMDLLTPAEERADQFTGHLRFDIPFLARRVIGVIDDMRHHVNAPLGLFGASTGAAAAIVAAATRPDKISAVVSRGGRPDLAGDALSAITAPTLLIVGEDDRAVLELNQRAKARMKGHAQLDIVPGATHLFNEPGALEAVAHLAADWFSNHLTRRGTPHETT